MGYYRVCPNCGAHLDPGEICDCKIKHDFSGGPIHQEGKKIIFDPSPKKEPSDKDA